MSHKKSTSHHREVWTEEEVMDFGLGGGEDYYEASMDEEDQTSISSPMLANDVTKSGRVRKKTAKLIEMEEADKLEKKLVLPRKLETGKTSGKKNKAVSQKLTPDQMKLESMTPLPDPEINLPQLADPQPFIIENVYSMNSPTRSSKEQLKMKLDFTPEQSANLSPSKSAKKKPKKKERESAVSAFESEVTFDYGGIAPPDSDVKEEFSLTIDEGCVNQGQDSVAVVQSRERDLEVDHLPKPKKLSNKRKCSLSTIKLEHAASSSALVQLAAYSAEVIPLSYQLQGDVSAQDSFPNETEHSKLLDEILPFKKDKTTKKLKTEFVESFSELEGLKKQMKLQKTLQKNKWRADANNRLVGQPKKKRQKGYTAYMLWCGVQRAKVVGQNPGIDFAQISKRLGDMWQTVPGKEKMTWRRKARKMAKKGSSLINMTRPKIVFDIPVPPEQSRMIHQNKATKPIKEKSFEDHSPVNFKVTNSDPMDVAAHLKLLGESLTVIGARLQEHKGQIAVQGSMSVLLDSLLCTLGPLMCLTNQVPELNGCPDDVHRSTLDNIAYIMPGVG